MNVTNTGKPFCRNFQKLSPNVKKRLAVENDDKATQWSITDLLPLHERLGKLLHSFQVVRARLCLDHIFIW